MATGIVGTLSASASLSYTPTANAKVKVAGFSTSTQLSVNGVVVAGEQNSSPCNFNFDLYVAAGVSVTFSSGPGVTAVVSSLEAS